MEHDRQAPAGPRSILGLPLYYWWRTVFFLIPAISVYTVVLGTLSIGASLFERHGAFSHGCARLWARLILLTTGVRVHVAGIERLTPGANYVFAANHQSIYDIPIVFSALPRQLRIIAKASLGHFPFLGWHLRRTGHLLVDRASPGAGILKRMGRLIQAGVSLVVFPEGTRSVDGRVGRFKAGVFLLAVEAGLPMVPVSIGHSRHVMGKGRLMVRPGAVTLTLHEPIDTKHLTRAEVRALAERVQRVVQAGVASAEAAAPSTAIDRTRPTGGAACEPR